MFRRLLALLSLPLIATALLACPASASPPTTDPVFHFALHPSALLSAPDTFVASFTCTQSQGASCLVTASVTGGTVDPLSLSTVLNGQPGQIKLICGAPNTTMTNFSGTLVATATGYTNSAPSALSTTSTLACPAKTLAPPSPFVLIFGPPHSGG